jgi:hypothetical protein
LLAQQLEDLHAPWQGSIENGFHDFAPLERTGAPASAGSRRHLG